MFSKVDVEHDQIESKVDTLQQATNARFEKLEKKIIAPVDAGLADHSWAGVASASTS